jgi:hypothetical protein
LNLIPAVKRTSAREGTWEGPRDGGEKRLLRLAFRRAAQDVNVVAAVVLDTELATGFTAISDTGRRAGGGVPAWNQFNPPHDTVSWVVGYVLGALDPERAVLHTQVPSPHRVVVLHRFPGPAGPMYLVVDDGRHRAHAMRILGVPLLAAEVLALAVPAFVEHKQLLQDGPLPCSPEAIWRGLMDHGLLDGDIVSGPRGPPCSPTAFRLRGYCSARPGRR